MTKKENFVYLLFFIAVFHVIVFGFKVVNQEQEIERLKNQPKTIIYKVDNAGGEIDRIGTITAKNVLEGRYTVTINGYGNFLVTKEQYDSLKIGDQMPEYLKGIGN
jgi:cell division protein FtsI/penicillin-binding protein 2